MTTWPKSVHGTWIRYNFNTRTIEKIFEYNPEMHGTAEFAIKDNLTVSGDKLEGWDSERYHIKNLDGDFVELMRSDVLCKDLLNEIHIMRVTICKDMK